MTKTPKNGKWPTPEYFMDQLHLKYGEFDLDPCCEEHTAKAPIYFTEETDGLIQPWFGRVFVNPPYSRKIIDQWIEKIDSEYKNCEIIVALLRLSCPSWFKHLKNAIKIDVLEKRIKFDSTPGKSPDFYNIVCVWVPWHEGGKPETTWGVDYV